MFRAAMAAIAIVLSASPVLSLTLDEAISTGLQNNPEMRAARLDEEAARGQMAKAKLPPFSNPVIEGSLSRQTRERGEVGGAFRNNQISISQNVEVAGQRGLRMDAAENNLDRSRHDIRDLERTLRADIGDAFARSLFLRDREALAKEYLGLQEDLAGLVSAKFEAGDVAALEVNLSRVELARARRDVIAASTEYGNSIASLKRLAGMPADASVSPEGSLDMPFPPLPPKEALLARVADRPDVKSAEAEVRRSRAAQRLAGREAIPGVTWSLFTGRTEGGNETGGSLSVSIPLFDRKQGERMEAKARATQARIREAGVTRTGQKEVGESYDAAASAAREVDLFRQSVLGLTMENLGLLQLAFREGKISFYDVRVAQRETIETRDAYLQALLAAQRAYNALERAIGGELR